MELDKLRIHKEPIKHTLCTLAMPLHSTILQFWEDPNGVLCIWYSFNPSSNEMCSREFKLVMTGEEFDANGYQFVGTAFSGKYVVHLYENLVPEDVCHEHSILS